jgi:UDP:flavonoid glycosyltransferase YjiC (YdhE family)
VAVTVARHTLEYHGLEFARGVVAALAADRHRQVVAGIEPLFHAALGEQPANVRLTTPHALAVLAPTCRAVVHDGDALTVLEWAATGVPQLALPQLVDECAIAERLAATGAGRVLREADEQEDPAAVQELVRAVIDDRAHAAAAERLREDVLAMPAPATLARELQDQVRAA